jgi:hypothetical protein
MAGVSATADVRGIAPMGKAMSIAGMVVGGLLAVAFALDLVAGFPFGGRSPMMAIGFMICGGTLAYLSWNAFREAS